jgi:hypothetical protein
MKILRQLFVAAAIFLLQNVPLDAQRIDYKPIPTGFDFPAPAKTLLDALKAGDEAKLRTHAWMVFAGLTQPAHPDDPASEALWETWYRADEVFSARAALQGERTLQRKLTVPRQFLPHGKGAQLQAVGESQLARLLFNRELRDHTRQNRLYLADTLATINRGWTAETPVVDRKVKDYPTKAMSLKTVWMRVKKQEVTGLPIWDEQSPVINAPEQPPPWKRAVAVDPTREIIPTGEKKDVVLIRQGRKVSFPSSSVVPLNAFYHFALPAAEGGDYMVLVAMHYTTKEIPNWVWATFWWHDQPDAGRFANNRPPATILRQPWRNYLMDVSYDMDIPKEPNDTPNAVFNPYLEARFADGVNSNCMTCHARAVWSPEEPQPGFLPVARGAPAPDAPIFKKGTKADFLWSLLYEGNQ